MRPIRLEMQAFGPYVKKQIIDFEGLSEKGIFLIKGPTGSGKTTIFDAMTFALYGGSSGDADGTKYGRNDFEEWRCNQAQKEDVTIVSFEFEANGQRYIFRRSLTPKRVNLSKELSACLIDDDGNAVPLFENPKDNDLKDKAVELIGLTKEQFRQVVLLPQGQFERFIVASSSDKEEILKKLFDSGNWEKYTQRFFDEAYDRVNSLKSDSDTIKNSLAEERRHGDLLGTDEEIDPAITSVDDLAVYITELTETCKRLDEDHKTFNGTNKYAILENDKELEKRFNMKRELESAKVKLEEIKPAVDKKRKMFEQATKAEDIAPFMTAYDKAVSETGNRQKVLERLRAGLPDMKKAQEEAELRLKEHTDSSPVEKNTARIGELNAKVGFYEKVDKLKKEKEQAEADLKKAEAVLKAAQADADNAKNNAATKLAELDLAEEHARDLRNSYYSGIYGQLANELKEGEPCPVCGSTDHPGPASLAPDSVSKEQVDMAEKAVDTAKKIWNEADGNSRHLMEVLEQKKREKDAAKAAFLKSDTEYSNTAENLVQGIPDLKALREEIGRLEKENTDYKDTSDRLTARAENARTNLQKQSTAIEGAENELKTAGEALESAEQSLKKILSEKGYTDADSARACLMTADERNALHEKIISYDKSCIDTENAIAAIMKELEGKTEPDPDTFVTRQTEIEQEKSRYDRESSKLTVEIKRLTEKHKMLAVLDKRVRNELNDAEEDLRFAKLLRGDTGLGLQRYVLAIMFDQVIGEANRMLSKVHGGRYRLFRTDDKAAGNKRGLELKVFDNRNPEDTEGRNVRMLSGGEKFLVSLALSIGMSTIAQKSGIKIEALFIDEGFGTLDEDSINDAMDVLEGVRQSSGMIGIISHVRVLEENIPTQLEVIKSSKGNYIVPA